MDYTQYYAILPTYDNYGANCTQVFLADGTKELVPLSVRTFIRQLHYNLFIDPRATKHWASQYVHSKYNMPLFISPEVIFLPCKTRTGVPHGDGCVGYILEKALAKIEGETISLTNGHSLIIQSNPNLLEKKRIDARNLRSAYLLTPPGRPFLPPQ